MSDQVEYVSEKGWGANFLSSIKGVAVGGLLFFVSFWVLWMNEGRVDLSEVAKKSTPVKADAIDTSANGKFVSITGPLKADGKLEDPEFLQPGAYINLNRDVEMYAWVEIKHTENRKKTGGKTETVVSFSHEKQWTRNPKSPQELVEPKGHENPSLPTESKNWVAPKAMVGAYPFKVPDADLPSGEQLRLSDEVLKAPKAEAAAEKTAAEKADDAAGEGDKVKAADESKDTAADEDDSKSKKKKKSKKRHGRKVRGKPPAPGSNKAATSIAERKAAEIANRKPASYVRANDTYLFRGSGSVDNPDIGDVRIGFRALQSGLQVTLFGSLKDGEVSAYIPGKDDIKLLRALKGSREEAIMALATEHKTIGWFLRILGFLMMWFGLSMFFGPLNVALDVIPALGKASRVLVGILMLPVSILLSIFTILLSIIFHNTLLLILFLAGLGGGGYFLYQKKKKT